MTCETTNNSNILAEFLASVKTSQTLWALQDKESEDWVVLDSINFENTDVMPLWSEQSLANQHCTQEWANYVPAQISLRDWFEFWIEDLNSDGVIIGINWPEDGDCTELELDEFTQSLAEVEKL